MNYPEYPIGALAVIFAVAVENLWCDKRHGAAKSESA
jgi:hypothetical protein